MNDHRRKLPTRRESESFELTHNWSPAGVPFFEHILVQFSRDPETGLIAEVFLNPLVPDKLNDGLTFKEHERPANTLRDLSTTISIALQYGVPLDVLAGAMGHGEINVAGITTDHPHTIQGAVLRELLVRQ